MKLIKAKIKKKQKQASPKGEYLSAVNQATGRIYGGDGQVKKIPYKYGSIG